MVEKAVDLVQRVLKKTVLEVNRREIPHLLYSPAQILFGFNPVSAFDIEFPVERRGAVAAGLSGVSPDIYLEEEEHLDRLVDYITNHAATQKVVLERSDHAKDRASARHDLGSRGIARYDRGDLVMLYDHRQAGKRLGPSWRGPFVVTGFEGDMGKSYTIRQINGTSIPRHYYGDSLKRFRLREGYLVTGEEGDLPIFQNIRPPKNIRTEL
ncbi:hypothetical protein K3495_g7774 [Podosphaera aphanis]|nr:hypothetical protein K3495_g7774 [Podosphaera aphanis]